MISSPSKHAEDQQASRRSDGVIFVVAVPSSSLTSKSCEQPGEGSVPVQMRSPMAAFIRTAFISK